VGDNADTVDNNAPAVPALSEWSVALIVLMMFASSRWTRGTIARRRGSA
jgi:hypothetical protein